MFGTCIKEMNKMREYREFHPCTTLLTGSALEISDSINIGPQAGVTINSWLREGRRMPKGE